MKTLLQSIRMLALLILLTGVIYPAVVWTVAQGFFRHQAEGSLVLKEGKIIGSELLSQKSTGDRYFHPRPSAADFATVASGASNLAWSSEKLGALIRERRAGYPAGVDIPAELLTASASGLDPDLSPEAVTMQARRVAEARRLSPEHSKTLAKLIENGVIGGQLSPRRINVLALNLDLDKYLPSP